MKDHSNSPILGKGRNSICLTTSGQDRQSILNYIIQRIEKGTGQSLQELRKQYTEDGLFYLGLRHITTTKKAFCEATGIPVEAACRCKRKLEKAGLLVQSADKTVCPFTRDMAHLISTNPEEFDKLRKSNSRQLNLFES